MFNGIIRLKYNPRAVFISLDAGVLYVIILNMRLDKFLKVSRLVKRRTVANNISELGRVFVNGNIAKPAKQLKVGDIIAIEYANKTVKAKVATIPTGNVPAQSASDLYELIEE